MDDRRFSDWSPEEQQKFLEDFDKGSYRANEAQQSSGYMYIRHLVLINGGALVAMLSFMGGLIGKGQNVAWTQRPMAYFLIGLIISVSLNGIEYLRLIVLNTLFTRAYKSFWDNKIIEKVFWNKLFWLRIIEVAWIWFEVGLGFGTLAFFIAGAISATTNFPRIPQ